MVNCEKRNGFIPDWVYFTLLQVNFYFVADMDNMVFSHIVPLFNLVYGALVLHRDTEQIVASNHLMDDLLVALYCCR